MIWFYGFITLINQTLLLKELSVLFQLNELILGILFFSWLTGSGLGSATFRYLPDSIRKLKSFGTSSLLVSQITVFVFIFVIRYIFGFFQYASAPNLIVISLISFLIIFPISFLLGTVFTFYATNNKKHSTSKIYFIEALSSFIGGLTFIFFLSGKVDALTISFVLIYIVCFFHMYRLKNLKMATILTIPLLASYLPLSGDITNLSQAIKWRNNSELLYSKTSNLGEVAIVKNLEQDSLYYNGKLVYSSQDRTYFEELSFLPYLINPNIKKILILGYTPYEIIENLATFNPEKITVVEQDKELASLIKAQYRNDRLFPESTELRTITTDPYLIKENIKEKFDFVILTKSLPYSISENRYFSLSFFKKINALLSDGAVFLLQAPYEENKTSNHTIMNLNYVLNSVKKVFKYTNIVPANKFYILGSNRSISDIKDRALKNLVIIPEASFLNEGYINHYMSNIRNIFFNDLMGKTNNQEINNLFDQKLYINNFLKWVKNNLKNSWIFIIIFISAILFLLVKFHHEIQETFSANKKSLIMFAIGFSCMSGEIFLLNLFQSISGHVYYLYAVLASTFMLGIGSGGLLSFYLPRYRTYKIKLLSPYFIVLWLAFIETLYITDIAINIGLFSFTLLIYLLNFLGGFFMGSYFNSVAIIYENKRVPGDKIVSRLYSFDLLGSALGALISSSLLYPLLGHLKTMVLIIVILVILLVTHQWRDYEY